MAVDQELQQLYAEGRKRGIFKADPELAELTQQAIKRGILQDLSQPAARPKPKPAVSSAAAMLGLSPTATYKPAATSRIEKSKANQEEYKRLQEASKRAFRQSAPTGFGGIPMQPAEINFSNTVMDRAANRAVTGRSMEEADPSLAAALFPDAYQYAQQKGFLPTAARMGLSLLEPSTIQQGLATGAGIGALETSLLPMFALQGIPGAIQAAREGDTGGAIASGLFAAAPLGAGRLARGTANQVRGVRARIATNKAKAFNETQGIIAAEARAQAGRDRAAQARLKTQPNRPLQALAAAERQIDASIARQKPPAPVAKRGLPVKAKVKAAPARIPPSANKPSIQASVQAVTKRPVTGKPAKKATLALGPYEANGVRLWIDEVRPDGTTVVRSITDDGQPTGSRTVFNTSQLANPVRRKPNVSQFKPEGEPPIENIPIPTRVQAATDSDTTVDTPVVPVPESTTKAAIAMPPRSAVPESSTTGVSPEPTPMTAVGTSAGKPKDSSVTSRLIRAGKSKVKPKKKEVSPDATNQRVQPESGIIQRAGTAPVRVPAKASGGDSDAVQSAGLPKPPVAKPPAKPTAGESVESATPPFVTSPKGDGTFDVVNSQTGEVVSNHPTQLKARNQAVKLEQNPPVQALAPEAAPSKPETAQEYVKRTGLKSIDEQAEDIYNAHIKSGLQSGKKINLPNGWKGKKDIIDYLRKAHDDPEYGNSIVTVGRKEYSIPTRDVQALADVPAVNTPEPPVKPITKATEAPDTHAAPDSPTDTNEAISRDIDSIRADDNDATVKVLTAIERMKKNGAKVDSLKTTLDTFRKLRSRDFTTRGDYLKEREVLLNELKAEMKGVLSVEEVSAPSEMNAGLNPGTAIRRADDLSIPPGGAPPKGGSPTGSFTVKRKPPDMGLMEAIRSPLSIIDVWGNTLLEGALERIGGALGRQASQRIIQTQNALHDLMHSWRSQIDDITLRVERSTKGIPKDQAYSNFIDLIEMDKSDPKRKGWDADSTQALATHDKLTEEFRRYIISERKKLGIDMPADWGITDQGYYRHLFLGDIKVFADGVPVGVARTYAEAQKIAIGILNDPKTANAKITAMGRDTFAGDPTVRVSSGKYFKTVGEIAKQTGLSHDEIMADIRGTIGRRAGKQKTLGALIKRQGAKGYDRDYKNVMRIHAYQVARSQELTKLNHDLQPMIEQFIKNEQPGVAEYLQGHINDLWGTPKAWEVQFGNSLARSPILRNNLSNPSMAFRGLTSYITKANSILKLRYNLRASIVNGLQPLTTLWPFISSKDFAGLYADFSKKSTRQMLREKGVFEGETKLEGADSEIHTSKLEGLKNPFGTMSQVNKGIGYLYGYRKAKAKGLTEAQAHQNGMAWMQKVEFDNSIYNAPPILRTPQGRLLGQFKGFAIKNTENIGVLPTKGSILQPGPGVSKGQKAARIGKFALAQTVVGGVNSLGMGAKAVGGVMLLQALAQQFKDHGWSDRDADAASEAIYYGAPTLLGQDLSASVAVLEAPYGRGVWEQAGNLLLGPTIGSIFGAAERYRTKGPVGAAMAVTPYTRPYEATRQYVRNFNGTQVPPDKPNSRVQESLEGAIPGASGAGMRIKTQQGKTIGLSRFETVMYGLGFTPVKQTAFYDNKEIDKKVRDRAIESITDMLRARGEIDKMNKDQSFKNHQDFKGLKSAEEAIKVSLTRYFSSAPREAMLDVTRRMNSITSMAQRNAKRSGKPVGQEIERLMEKYQEAPTSTVLKDAGKGVLPTIPFLPR